ncbi:dipeptide/oligopeptide/nickel ABC transporter permease/ATP-binding protein [Demequina salsinemoris]|uniref:dipeptide/oligopeptide/nickel ABC transporter permease/ATP-binding protein n=1 Tax=Demequina salsinemoris TaxID=577470 RepID=UPI000783B74D|nr:dipeptide/oligopeptide/nickel ABC transporter permease/ATP-binding protein [Demequina salsinemoris]
MTAQKTSRRPAKHAAPGAIRTIVRSPWGLAAAIWILGLLIASLTSSLWLPYDVLEQDLSAIQQGPSVEHWLGTDQLGRDILSRIVHSAASTIGLGAITAAVGLSVALPAALLSARNARAETMVNRVSEVMMSIPGMTVILAFIAVVGTNMPLVMMLLGLLISAGIYRIILGQAKSIQTQLFIEAAEVDGLRKSSISFRHVLPNMMTTITVQAMLLLAMGIMTQAGLAFIGFGPQPPEPTWGGLIQDASKYLYTFPWMMVPTGLVLALTVIAFNSLGDLLSQGQASPPPLVQLRQRVSRAAKAHRRESLAQASSGERASAANVLEVRDLVVGVEDGPDIVTGASLRVEPGRVMALVGESGCGKSVTSFALLGLLAPGLEVRGGSATWNGMNIAASTDAEMATIRGREIAFISQEPMRALDPMFTISSQLTQVIRRLRGVDRAASKRIAAELLEQVGIVDVPRVLKSYPHQISGGMAQRIAIALALAGEPRLIVADEPTTALDVTVQAEILGLLKHLVDETGMSMVLVTHDLGVVADIADDVSVMYAGQIVEVGSAEAVLVSPEHPYTMALLAADPHLTVVSDGRDRLASIPGQVPTPEAWSTGCRFAERCLFATDSCRKPVELSERAKDEGLVRCVHRDAVAGRQNAWREPAVVGSVVEEA